MKRLLYIGIHLSAKGRNPSVAESVAPLLLHEGYALRLVSDQRLRVLRMLHMMWAVLRYARRESPVWIDVFSTTASFYYALTAGILCRCLGAPYVCVLHGGNLPWRLRQSPRLCRMLLAPARLLAAPSAYLVEAFAHEGYTVQWLPNFIRLAACPVGLQTLQEGREAPFLLWVRAFSRIYNPGLAIEALRLLRPDFPALRLIMVGPDKDGSMAACRAQADRCGLGDAVQFTGQLSKVAWLDLCAKTQAFVNTSDFDNAPVSLLEAMAVGAPVVSTRVGGIPWLVEHEREGLLVPPGDPEALAQAVRRLLSDPVLAQRLGGQAQRKAALFDWSQVAHRWRAVLEEGSAPPARRRQA